MIFNKKPYLFLVILFVSIIFVALIYCFGKNIIFVNEHWFLVDVANTEQARNRGLGGRERLCKHCGMLFVFDKSDTYTFWMKDMKFDIDIVWISDDVVADISPNISHLTPQKLIKPSVRVDKVLELPAGSVELFKIKKGQKVVSY